MSWKQFETEPTADLIEYMRWREQPGYAESAKYAFSAFCFRFQKDLVTKCRVMARNYKFIAEVGDIVAERTFDRFWRYGCKSFDITKAKSKSSDIDKQTKYYLYRIASRVMIDYKTEQISRNPYNGDEEIIWDFSSFEIGVSEPERKIELKRMKEIIDKAFERLTVKHKIIYLTYLFHRKNGYNMPRLLLQKLRDALDLTQDSVGVYNKEANDAIKQYMELYGK